MSKVNYQGIDADTIEWEDDDDPVIPLRIKGPLFTDHCGHDPKEYVASYRVITIEDEKGVYNYYDLYAWDNPRWGGTNLCIRDGNGPGDYFSPGPCLTYFMQNALHPEDPFDVYQAALEILKAKGKFYWVWNDKINKEKKDESVKQESEAG